MRLALLALPLLLVATSSSGCLNGILHSEPGPKDYLSAKTYDHWVIEVDTIQNEAPPQQAVDLLISRLKDVANKPAGIDYQLDESLPARGGTWSDKDIQDYAATHHGIKTSGNTVVLHLLYLDGSYTAQGVLAITYGHDLIAVFPESIRAACSLLNGCTNSEPGFEAVLVHEFGHAMGLVNNGIPMVHPHEASTCSASGQAVPDRGHSDNSQSVMYCSVDQGNLFRLFTGGIPTSYDANDKADLCAAGGKCP